MHVEMAQSMLARFWWSMKGNYTATQDGWTFYIFFKLSSEYSLLQISMIQSLPLISWSGSDRKDFSVTWAHKPKAWPLNLPFQRNITKGEATEITWKLKLMLITCEINHASASVAAWNLQEPSVLEFPLTKIEKVAICFFADLSFIS